MLRIKSDIKRKWKTCIVSVFVHKMAVSVFTRITAGSVGLFHYVFISRIHARAFTWWFLFLNECIKKLWHLILTYCLSSHQFWTVVLNGLYILSIFILFARNSRWDVDNFYNSLSAFDSYLSSLCWYNHYFHNKYKNRQRHNKRDRQKAKITTMKSIEYKCKWSFCFLADFIHSALFDGNSLSIYKRCEHVRFFFLTFALHTVVSYKWNLCFYANRWSSMYPRL